MPINFKKLLPHLAVVIIFIIASLTYFSPVLQGKKIFQSDIVQYTGMAKEQNDHRKAKKEEPYWTNSAFGGMPTYQLGANYPHNYVKKVDRLIRFLPRPADYLFLYFISFYILLLVLKTDYKYAFLGALAFGFSTYLVIILGVGHNAKAHAIGYFPLVLAGILLTFQRKYLYGFLLTAFAMALEIGANHFQMTYYLMLLVLVFGAVYLIDAFKKKELPHFFKSVIILIGAVILSIAANATNIMATQEYVKWSIRGASELTFNEDGSPKEKSSGLSKEYITEFSYGIGESINLFAPRLYGGGSGDGLTEESATFDYLAKQGVPRAQAKEIVSGLPTYWGDQIIVEAPAYVGTVIIFLFILALFVVKGKTKWWLLGGVIMSLLLSWGRNFSTLTNFMIDYFPMYNKFRAVSSIQVILEFCIPILAIYGLFKLFQLKNKEEQIKSLKFASATALGVVILLFLIKGSFSFVGIRDGALRQQFSQFGLGQIVDFIIIDRKSMYTEDLIRSLILILLSSGVVWLTLKEKIKETYMIVAFSCLVIFDLGSVDKRYVNKDDFVQARIMEKPFSPNPADTEILKDKGHYRVFDQTQGYNTGRASYFHQSIGGYNAARPRRFEELFYYQIAKNNVSALNMLNVKYLIQQDEEGKIYPAQNPFVTGNAWFVDVLDVVDSADEEMKALDDFDEENEVILNKNDVPQEILSKTFVKDSTATIDLISYQPNALKYKSNAVTDQLAVFSEMYYPHGWNVYVDGEKASHFRANYVLRAMEVPKGNHTIEFKFEPAVVKRGSMIALGSTILFGLMFIGGLYLEWKKKQGNSSQEKEA
ncbi:YfhO family protein [Flavobacteriaceae bacterium R38]|nr:YfhO family protein [Flavobacteriaceae bacterium R38]